MADKKISQLPAATLPLAGTELLPIVQSGTTDNITVNNLAAGNIKSNATTGVLQVTGPAAASTRVMTVPNANFTVARTDAAQNFTGSNTFDTTTLCVDSANHNVGVGVATPYVPNGATEKSLEVYSSGLVGSVYATAVQQGLVRGGTYAVSFGDSSVNVGAITNHQVNLLVNNTAVANLSTAGNVTVSTGNLVIGTSGKGIDFSATASGSGTMTSELLADYEEGTWTAVVAGDGTSGTYELSTNLCSYTKIGRLVTVNASIVIQNPVTGGGVGNLIVSGLPYTKRANTYPIGTASMQGITLNASGNLVSEFGTTGAGATIYFSQSVTNTSVSYVGISSVSATDSIRFSITYEV